MYTHCRMGTEEFESGSPLHTNCPYLFKMANGTAPKNTHSKSFLHSFFSLLSHVEKIFYILAAARCRENENLCCPKMLHYVFCRRRRRCRFSFHSIHTFYASMYTNTYTEKESERTWIRCGYMWIDEWRAYISLAILSVWKNFSFVAKAVFACKRHYIKIENERMLNNTHTHTRRVYIEDGFGRVHMYNAARDPK